MSIVKESIESEITRYIKEILNRTDSEAVSMKLSEKMYLVEMSDKNKWNEFKIGLRESGYVI